MYVHVCVCIFMCVCTSVYACMGVWVPMYMCYSAHEGQRSTLERQFSATILWDTGIKLWTSGLGAMAFTCWAILAVLKILILPWCHEHSQNQNLLWQNDIDLYTTCSITYSPLSFCILSSSSCLYTSYSVIITESIPNSRVEAWTCCQWDSYLSLSSCVSS